MKKFLLLLVLLIIIGAIYYVYNLATTEVLPAGIASGNGRIEATEIDIASKTAGRIEEIFVREGDYVTSGQVLAKMDTHQLDAQKRQAEAQLRQAVIQVETAKIQVTQRQSEKAAAEATLKQRESALAAEARRLQRTERLGETQNVSREEVDDQRSRTMEAQAAVAAANAQVSAAEAAINSARSLVVNAEAAVEAAEATIERIQADIDDSTLISPRDGRIQYRIAQPGEVLSAGGNVVNLVDLTVVYMTFFLPTEQAGRIAIGDDVRLVLDAAPEHVIPAKATFVSDVAQFTPKTVETAEEREKLMFRVKAHIPPELLRKYITHVKTGLPGRAFVRVDPDAHWPDDLEVTIE